MLQGKVFFQSNGNRVNPVDSLSQYRGDMHNTLLQINVDCIAFTTQTVLQSQYYCMFLQMGLMV